MLILFAQGNLQARAPGLHLVLVGTHLDELKESAPQRVRRMRREVERVLKQIKAVQGALDKVGVLVLKSHLRDHVVTAAQRGDTDEILAELMEVLKYR